MFFELSKLLNFFLFPVTWIVALLIGSMALRKYPWVRKLCLWGSAVLFLVFTNGPLFDLAKSSMIEEYRFPHWEEGKIYRVAIVMGGFAGMNKERGILQYEQNRADRLWEAVRLFRTGKVNRILITGDPSSSLKPDGSRMDTEFLRYMQEHGIPPDIFLLEQQARYSKENAAYSVAMLSSLGIPDRDCLLITSATHMERARGCFSALGWHPDWFPVGLTTPSASLNCRSFYPSWEIAIKWQELFNEWMGKIIYRLAGYTE